MAQIGIRFDDDDHEFLRKYSFENKKSINQIVVELVKKLREETEKESTPPPSR